MEPEPGQSDEWRLPLLAKVDQLEATLQDTHRWHPLNWYLQHRVRKLRRDLELGWR